MPVTRADGPARVAPWVGEQIKDTVTSIDIPASATSAMTAAYVPLERHSLAVIPRRYLTRGGRWQDGSKKLAGYENAHDSTAEQISSNAA